MPPSKACMVCGDKALGYNFNAISCESCKAFFRRNALARKDFTCPFNQNCDISVVTRRFCQKCRLKKCFDIGMKSENIMSEEDKVVKRKKIEQNRAKRKRPEDKLSEDAMGKLKRDNAAARIGSEINYDPNVSISNISCDSQSWCSFGSESPNQFNYHLTDELTAAQLVDKIVSNPERGAQAINVLMRSPKEAVEIMDKIINSKTEALRLISHLISYPGDALKIISKIMNSPFDALTVFTKFMSSPTDALEIISKVVNSPQDVLEFLRQIMNSPEDALDIMNKFMNTPAEALKMINKMVKGGTDHDDCMLAATASTTSITTPETQTDDKNDKVVCEKKIEDKKSKNNCESVNEHIITTSKYNNECTIINAMLGNTDYVNNNEEPSSTDSESFVHAELRTNENGIKHFLAGSNVGNFANSIESVLFEVIRIEYQGFNSLPQTCGSGRELNEVEQCKLNELKAASEALYYPLDTDLSSLVIDEDRNKSEESLQDPQLLKVINLTAVAIKRLIKMSKKITAFRNMCQEDQVALLKGGCTEMMIMRSVMSYDCDRATWKIPHSKEDMSNIKVDVLKLAKGNVYEEHDRFIQTFDPKWRADENIILIMCAIVLFMPTRPRIVHSDVIKLEQSSYYYLLRRYLESVYPSCEAKSTFIKLIQKITELERLNQCFIGVYLNVNPSQIEPLLREIFDLKNH